MVPRNPLALSVRIVYDKRIRYIKNSTSCQGSDRPNSAAVVDSHVDVKAAVALILVLKTWISTDDYMTRVRRCSYLLVVISILLEFCRDLMSRFRA